MPNNNRRDRNHSFRTQYQLGLNPSKKAASSQWRVGIVRTLSTLILAAGLHLPTPAIAQSTRPNELTVEFDTGGDDLRGGNDNVHLLLLLRTGAPLRFNNVNDLRRWGDNSRHTVTRSLPSTLRFEDIVGVRLETTFSGGIGGDNWNLDRLQVSAQLRGEARTLLNRQGTPLVRFTGDQRVREFRFSSAPVPPAPPVMTSFDPTRHGFKFVNEFKNLFISEINWVTSGLCGGMVYSALDYFNAGARIPQQNYMPAEGMPLQSYLYNRQVNSLIPNVDKWVELNVNVGGARNREFFNWGLQAGSGRLGELQERIDRGIPVPLGLKGCGDDCQCPDGCPSDHQVLAIGYELGRYKGDLGSNIEDLSIFVYDPNLPNEILTLKPDVAGAMYFYKERPERRWRAYFVDTKYSRVNPPAISDRPNELIAQFGTGGDDLRGGNDNVHLLLLLRSGGSIRFNNVNNLKRWIDHSSQTISRPLPENFRAEDIIGVRLETTFGGGIGGDNWNLDSLRIQVKLQGETRTLFESAGSPLFRFTGDQRVREFRLPRS